MKKIILSALIMVFGFGNAFAQLDDAENNVKNFRFGLKAEPTFNFLTPDNKKKFENGGTVIGFGWGAMMEFRLNKNTSIATGFGLSWDGYKMNFIHSSDTAYYGYMLNADEELQTLSLDSASLTDLNLFKLNQRKYKLSYVNIPFTVKMKTNEVGYLTYFGQFGANIGIRTGGKVDDTVLPWSNTGFSSEDTNTDIDLKNGAAPIRMGLTIGGGAEYNFSGNTSAVFGISYDHFFTNALKKNDEYLRLTESTTEVKTFDQKAAARAIRITLGILF